jgi:hypothetical protein
MGREICILVSSKFITIFRKTGAKNDSICSEEIGKHVLEQTLKAFIDPNQP